LSIHTGNLTGVQALTRYCEKEPTSSAAGLALEALIEGSLKAFRLSLARWCIDLWLEHRPGNLDQARGLLWQGRLLEFSQGFPQALFPSAIMTRRFSPALALGQPLPTLPLWLADDLAIPLELEPSYEETCRVLRIR
jgi:hypothetical protein